MQPKQAGVLVIDSVALVRDQISSVLQSEGLVKVTCLETPAAALELLETKPCHLIFTDWQLGSLTGLEFLKKIRSHSYPRVRNICFIVLTADATRESIEQAVAAGADDYILKPLTSNQIQSRVTSLLMKVSVEQ